MINQNKIKLTSHKAIMLEKENEFPFSAPQKCFSFFMVSSILLTLLLVLSLSSVLAEFNYSENIRSQEMSLNISNHVYSTSSKLGANLLIFPLNNERQISKITAFPDSNLVSSINSINFKFNEKGNLNFGLYSNVKTNFLLNELKEISLEDMRKQANISELEIYKKSSSYSDSDNLIIKNKAQQLVKTNNSVEVLYALAEYVRSNMNYNLEKQDLKKASEIIQEKQGVCSHYTILFIALARALGFPSRYISGVAYSNKINDFQEHAWTEVYLNGEWIPFDITFGQYGWLDTSHIAFKNSVDAGEPSVSYSYVGGYIQPEPISIKTKVLSYNGNIFSNISIELDAYKEEVSPESYVPIKVRIKNNNDYYIALPVRVSIAPKVYGNIQKILLLEPNSIQETYFLIYLPYEARCSRGCKTYVEIRDMFNHSQIQELTFSDFDEKVTLQEAIKIINEPKSEDIDFYCKLENLSKENKTILCSINCEKEEKLKLCFKDQCFEQFFEKNKLTEVQIKIQTNESRACINLEDTNITLSSCVNLLKEKEKSFFKKLIEWINFQLTGFMFFLQNL